MSKIQEIIVEPSKIEAGSIFKLKVKAIDDYKVKQNIISENNSCMITENKEKMITEWGE